MSSVSPTPTMSRTQMSNPSNFPGGGGGNQTSNLYLYTFLATLLLLLTISVVVVGRSIIIRRRARRMIEEAIRNGTWLPPAGRPVVKLGEKPKLFDVYTTMDGIPGRSPLDVSLLAWEDLKPLSVTLKKSVPLSPEAPVVRSSMSIEPPPSLLYRLAPQLRPSPQIATPDSSAYPLETRQPPHNTALTISVIIAMPTPSTAKPHNSFEDTFPPVQVGVTDLPIPQGWTMDVKSESR
ncbi:hypothetical protein BDM02DRAFT_3264253 [Thelephora ganbajun]|uniref:Uncharacterized protein n=1 Tax=Thelephora ganbajun TaxID=370292 RepID=A0ACB6Z1A4_THEGA|nr:hypothetical protein BDM02DRAFT_3264253 [Thelephora ganbajun]